MCVCHGFVNSTSSIPLWIANICTVICFTPRIYLDCYVAVTGLPEPRKDHAVAMARFARDCLVKMRYLSKRLEVTLGPDTGDLAMRIGMHR